MTSHLVSTPVNRGSIGRSNSWQEPKRKTRKARPHPPANSGAIIEVPWRSEAQQRAYSFKLLWALVHGRLRRGGSVREAADRTLAAAAKGRSRWSRAILTSRRLKLKFRKQNYKRRRPGVTVTDCGRSLRKARVSGIRLKGRAVPAVHRKVRALGRLVPGCNKEPLPVILEEASDYIAALEMQVKSMTALAQILSGASSSSAPALPQPPPQ
ncbi:hypothetical protein SAY86_029892 [Trapa natans]|uniref:Uncharacterized protein n=1 Tax=Trapa natans TaxID=22666 RepID=A0AAN7RGL5_TRANT|nr:hypothetical protein SAY86_029892 [Trapa natans]